MLSIVFGILSIFSSSGFGDKPTTLLCSDTVRLSSKNKIKSDTARYVLINRIFIIGNKVTRDQIILRELSFKSGDITDSTELHLIIDRDKKKLYNTRLFNSTDIRVLALEPGKIDLLVEVNERWYTFPSPRFELSDRNLNEWWQNYDHDFRRVIYGLKLYQYNMRGRNETLILTALFGFQRKFSVVYRIPYIDGKQKQGLILDFDFTEGKNVAYKTEDHKLVFLRSRERERITRLVGLTYTYRNSFYRTHAIRAEYASNWISDSIYTLNSNYYGESRMRQKYATLSYQFIAEHRDIVAYPLNGYYFTAFLQKTGLGLGDDVNKTEGAISYARYVDLKNGYYFSNYTNGYLSGPQDVPYSHYGALGYKKQFVKGYEIYVLEGPFYMLNKSTIKKRIFSRQYTWSFMPRKFETIPLSIYLKTYADLGFVKNYPFYEEKGLNTILTDKILAGIGGGFDIVASYDLVIRVEYTFNSQGNNGFFLHVKKEF
jgi:outer membrane protein assembly factor BamA